MSAANPNGNAFTDPPENVKPESGKPGLYEKKNLTRRMSENFERTKVITANGMKKMANGVKEGASVSAYWMKHKYNSFKNQRK